MIRSSALVLVGGIALLSVGLAGGLLRDDTSDRRDESGKPEPSIAATDETAPPERPYSLTKRTPWTTSRFRGRPEPPLPFRAERVFANARFKSPTDLGMPPSSKWMYVTEQGGKVYAFSTEDPQATPHQVLDVASLIAPLAKRDGDQYRLDALYGITFHPNFAENRYCYLCYVVAYAGPNKPQHPSGTRVVRLKVSETSPPTIDPKSETLIISWLQGGHNGGCLKFGPDGCLYISSGDGGNAFPPDGHNSGQDVSNLLASIMRIDVDHAKEGEPYTIPTDNPFVANKNARGEIWAFGLRNPWKISFDRKTGDLWAGDVGWELWELVYRVVKGGNYGWSVVEGRQSVNPDRKVGPTPILPPTIEVPHTEGASVTGGFVYRGKKFPELTGMYVFGDWETRRIWGVPVDDEKLGERREVVEPTVRIVSFAEDHDGELYLLDFDDGTIHGLVRSRVDAKRPPFPQKLSETGLFASVAEHRMSEGVLPFSINAEMWSDHATAERFLAVPGEGRIALHAQPHDIAGSMFRRTLDFPADTVLIRTASLEMKAGDPSSRKRIETQALHYDGREWRGYTYRWNDEQTDATLVAAGGDDRMLEVIDTNSPGGKRLQSWHYPARMECVRCHNPWAEHTLAFNVPQLNRDHDYHGVVDNQIRVLRHIGIFEDVPGPAKKGETAARQPARSPEQLPRLTNPYDAAADINQRARSYLHVNCAHCHREGGGGSAYVHLPFDISLSSMKSLDKRPSQGTLGLPDAYTIAAGDPYKSVLYYRMVKAGPGHMPQIGARLIDDRGLGIVHDWIQQLPSRTADSAKIDRLAQRLPFDAKLIDAKELTDPQQQAVQAWKQSIDKQLTELLADPSTGLMLARSIRKNRLPEPTRRIAIAAGAAHSDAAVRDLFDPLLPDSERIKRLGETFRPADVLGVTGDSNRGEQLFHEAAGVQCRNCHRVAMRGVEVGPDLTTIGKKHDRARLLENLVDPSKVVEPAYTTWLVQTVDGQVLTGLVIKKDDRQLTLKDAQNKLHTLQTDEIEALRAQKKSLMPDMLLRDLTAQQAADLLAYLESLK